MCCDMEVCVLFLCTLTLLSSVSTIRYIDDDDTTVSIHPGGNIYVRYGDNLTIWCKVKGEGTSANLAFTSGGNPVKFEVVNKTTIKLFIKKPEQHPSYGYYCKNNKTRTGKGDSAFVTVAAPPANVTDFKCISYNLDALRCSWTTPDKVINTHYMLTMLVQGNSYDCTPNEVRETPTVYYCTWDTTKEPRYRPREKQLSFILKSHNSIDATKQEFQLDHYAVVKPNKPTNVSVDAVKPHSVLLQWTIPYNIFLLLREGNEQLEHKIEYQVVNSDNKSYFHEVDTSILPREVNYEKYWFILTDLPHAHMKYNVRMAIKLNRANGDEYWSDFKEQEFYTTSERPRRPPDMIAGGFNQNMFDDSRMVYIYWKQLEEYEEAGGNFTYKVVAKQGSKNYTYFPEKNKSLGYLYLNTATLDAMQISVWSYNEMGQSADSSYLYIPPEKETRYLRMYSFTKLSYENGTYELSWFGIPNIDNYTLFWCSHNTTDICNSRINFTVLKPNYDTYTIDLPNDHRYQFAISANNGTRSSGMIWTKCDISIDNIAMYGFPVRFYEKKSGKNFVNLKWSMECKLKDGVLISYSITYCPVLDASTTCNNTIEAATRITINDTKQMEINISGLRSYTTYQFEMSLNTTYGPKTIENAVARIRTSEDTPNIPTNVIIRNVQSDNLIMSWDPPEYLNGQFGNINYEIFNYENNKTRKILLVIKHKDIIWTKESRIEVKLENLDSFTNYSLSVRSCNEGIGTCSNRTSDVYVRTKIGKPSKLTVAYKENTFIKWKPPKFPGGNVDFYEIKITKDNYSKTVKTKKFEYVLKACEGEEKYVTYKVRAVNLENFAKNGVLAYTKSLELPERHKNDLIIFRGDWSDENKVMCRDKQKDFLLANIMFVILAIGSVISWTKWYWNKKKIESSIHPKYPPNLLIPEKEKDSFTTAAPSQDASKKEEAQNHCSVTGSDPSNKNTSSIIDKAEHYAKTAPTYQVSQINNTYVSNNNSIYCMPVNKASMTNSCVNQDNVNNKIRQSEMLTQGDIKRALPLKEHELITPANDQSYVQVGAIPSITYTNPIQTSAQSNGYTVLENMKHQSKNPSRKSEFNELRDMTKKHRDFSNKELPSNSTEQIYIKLSDISNPKTSEPRHEDIKKTDLPHSAKFRINSLLSQLQPEINETLSASKVPNYVQASEVLSSKFTKPNKLLTTADANTILQDKHDRSNDSIRLVKGQRSLDNDEIVRDFLPKNNGSPPKSEEQSYVQFGSMLSPKTLPKTVNGYTVFEDTNQQQATSSRRILDDIVDKSIIELPLSYEHRLTDTDNQSEKSSNNSTNPSNLFIKTEEFNSHSSGGTEQEKENDGNNLEQTSATPLLKTENGYVLRPEVFAKPQCTL